MRRLIAYLLVLIAASPAAAGAASAQDDACEDVAACITRVDASIGEGMAALDEHRGFRDAFAAAVDTSATSSTGFLALPQGEQEALIAYLRMPGEALAGMDADPIPDEVRVLHDSAAAYWTLMPEMMQTIAGEGPSAAMPFFEDLETASRENVDAQEGLRAACPGEVSAWADAYAQLGAPGPGTPAAGFLTVWDRHAEDNVEGLGYPFLFFATDDAVNAATPAAATPAIGRTTA